MDKPDGFVEVEFSGLELGAYETKEGVRFTAKATGIALVNRKAYRTGGAVGQTGYTARLLGRCPRRSRRAALARMGSITHASGVAVAKGENNYVRESEYTVQEMDDNHQ